MLAPREVGAAEFKARSLELMSEVERLGTEIVITRHRKPVTHDRKIREHSETTTNCRCIGC
jgi:antitoxin (DNA-binding transcriptional repressor) of toxin-antitoxin stability system